MQFCERNTCMRAPYKRPQTRPARPGRKLPSHTEFSRAKHAAKWSFPEILGFNFKCHCGDVSSHTDQQGTPQMFCVTGADNKDQSKQAHTHTHDESSNRLQKNCSNHANTAHNFTEVEHGQAVPVANLSGSTNLHRPGSSHCPTKMQRMFLHALAAQC